MNSSLSSKYMFVGFFIAALFMIVIGVQTAQSNAATYDEPELLAAGYSYLAMHDFRMEQIEPPLEKMIAALPLLLLHPKFKIDSPEWMSGDWWAFGRAMLYYWNDGEKLLFWGRMTTVAVALVLAFFVLLWSSEIYQGSLAGLISLSFLILTPDLLAHSTIVQSDVILTTCLFVATYGFAQFLRRADIGNALLTGSALVFAILAKHAAWIALAWFFPLAIWRIVSRETWTWKWQRRRIELETRKTKTLALVLTAVIWVGTAILSIWSIYGFTYDTRKVAISTPFAFVAEPTDNSAKAAARYVIQRFEPLPRPYLWGIGKLTESHVVPTFLRGQIYPNGTYIYFPFTLMAKSPIPFLILVAMVVLIVLSSFRRSLKSLTIDKLALILPVPIWLGVAILSRTNIGNRHILEIYPFLAVWVGYWGTRWCRKRLVPILIVITALVWQVWSVLSVHPYYLSYMNEFVGGPANGYRYLADSSVDWGQGLKAFATYWRGAGKPPLSLVYFGQAEPAYYGIRSTPLVSGEPDELAGRMVAVSASSYQLDSTWNPQSAVPSLHRFPPSDLVAYSILIFDFRNCSAQEIRDVNTLCMKQP